jgi:hypothetical protein
MTPAEGLVWLQEGFNLEYFDGECWFLLTKDHPVRLLWEYPIREKE